MVGLLRVGILCLMLLGWPGAGQAAPEPQPFLGAWRGTWDLSVGAFLRDRRDDNGQDGVTLRNLQWRADVDLAPGLRWHTLVRSNSQLDSLSKWEPMFEENYLEAYRFHRDRSGVWSGSLRVGRMRYLHFPYPDTLAIFDTVPSTADLQGGAYQGYGGALLTLDYAHRSGLGAHLTGIDWGFGRTGGFKMLENYLYYRRDFGAVHFEGRYGGLLTRVQPLGNQATGYNLFIGTKWKGYQAGLLFEKLQGQPMFTGVMLSFTPTAVTRALGTVAFDWDRRPSGFAVQLPLLSGRFGGIRKDVPPGGVLVGEVVAERLRTYCSNGQVRNYYEHRLSAWGETGGSDLVVVMKEKPWYLQAEAVVSPHSFAVGFTEWDKDRTGPAQISQTVSYRFYRLPRESKAAAAP